MIARWTRAVAVGACVLGLVGEASAQLKPERAYYLVNQPVPMGVDIPGDAPGAAEVQLLGPDDSGVLGRAPVSGGVADLASLFPELWSGPPRLIYAQLVVDGKKTGPAVVLQPLLTPRYAPRNGRTGEPMFPAGAEAAKAPVFSGVRAYVDKHVVLSTSEGEIEIRLRPDAAPNTVWNFRRLVEDGFYTQVAFHRVASLRATARADIVQAGDPLGTGQGGPGYMIDLEKSPLRHGFGVVGMARNEREPNSAGSQFYIGLSREGTASLDGRYASFGEVVAGEEALLAIAATPVDADNRPLSAPVISSARLVDAPPHGEGPPPLEDPVLKTPAR